MQENVIQDNYMKIILEKAGRIYIYICNPEDMENVSLIKRFLEEYQVNNKFVGCISFDIENKDNAIWADTVTYQKNDLIFIASDLSDRYSLADIYTNFEKSHVHALQIIPDTVGLFPILKKIKGYSRLNSNKGCYVPGLANIDIVDTCNLQCATCPRSVFRGSSTKMSIKKFKEILDKLKALNVSRIELYNWTEPFLHPDILSFVREVKKRGFQCGISSNFSLKNIQNLKEVVDLLDDPQDLLVVTISGLNQKIHEINHVNGNVENVLENLKIASSSVNHNKIWLRLLKFPYNHGEIEKVKALANALKIQYEIHQAMGNPLTGGTMSALKSFSDKERTMFDSKNYNKLFDNISFCAYSTMHSITINANGNVHLCCNAEPDMSYEVGSFLEQDIFEIQLKRLFHPKCLSCKMLMDNSPDEGVLNTFLQGMENYIFDKARRYDFNIEGKKIDFLEKASDYFMEHKS